MWLVWVSVLGEFDLTKFALLFGVGFIASQFALALQLTWGNGTFSFRIAAIGWVAVMIFLIPRRGEYSRAWICMVGDWSNYVVLLALVISFLLKRYDSGVLAWITAGIVVAHLYNLGGYIDMMNSKQYFGVVTSGFAAFLLSISCHIIREDAQDFWDPYLWTTFGLCSFLVLLAISFLVKEDEEEIPTKGSNIFDIITSYKEQREMML